MTNLLHAKLKTKYKYTILREYVYIFGDIVSIDQTKLIRGENIDVKIKDIKDETMIGEFPIFNKIPEQKFINEIKTLEFK